MSLTIDQKSEIKKYLFNKIKDKLNTYDRETTAMPFHIRLFGENRLATYSFIHSCNTMLGQSIFEQIGELIAKPHFEIAKAQYTKFKGSISDDALLIIDHIMSDLKTADREVNKKEEIKQILSKQKGSKELISRVDLYLKDKQGKEYFFELKTAKPNISEFTSVKRKLLEWVAMSGKEVSTMVCIPYNPYHPQPYQRWTLKGLFDLKEEILVGKEFWDFLGGENTFKDLLSIFEDVGKEIYHEIESKIKNIAKATKEKSI
jgi:type II restriction enzyme